MPVVLQRRPTLVVCVFAAIAMGCHTDPSQMHARTGSSLDATVEDAFVSPEFHLSLTLADSGRELVVTGLETNPTTSEGELWRMSEFVSEGVIECATMRHANDWYLAIRMPHGGFRVERWELSRTAGAYYTDMPTASTRIGVPVTTPAIAVRIHADGYVSPPLRERPKVSRAPLLPNLIDEEIRNLAVDPDGRYLILQTSTASGIQLLQVAVAASPELSSSIGRTVVLWDSSQNPEFLGLTAAGMHDHPDFGRAFVVGDTWMKVCLWDAENDGVFDRVEVVNSLEEWFKKYPYESWSRNF